MSSKKYTKEYIENEICPEIKEKLKKEGKSTDKPPSYKWLNNNGYSGLHRAVSREYGDNMTIQDVMIEYCDFVSQSHDEKNKLESFIEDLDDHQKLAESTQESKKSRLLTIHSLTKKIMLEPNLIKLASGTEGSGFQILVKVFEAIDDYYESDQSKINYATDLKKFYEYCRRRNWVDHNPAEKILEEFRWTRDTEFSAEALSVDQIQRMWSAAETIEEQALIALFAGAGARPSDVIRIDAREDIHFEDAKIEYTERKNGPGTAVIMGGLDAIKYHIDSHQSNEKWNGKVFPSFSSESGSRTDQTLRNWTKEIAERADVTLEEGDTPTPKNLRKFWYTLYSRSNSELYRAIQTATEEQGSSSADVVSANYVDKEERVKQFREYARDKFEKALPDNKLIHPDTKDDKDPKSNKGQSRISDYS